MDKDKIKKLIPLGLIIVGLVYTTINVLVSDTVVTQGHLIAYGLTFVIIVFYFINTKISNVILGITLILGLLNIVKFTPLTMTIGGGFVYPDSEITIALQLFSLIVSIIFYYVHRQSIVSWFNKDGL